MALQPGTLVELSCDAESQTPEKCEDPPCVVCMHRWCLSVVEGDSAGLFMLLNRSMPWKRKFRLSRVVKHASFRRPVVSVDGIANAQCASGEPPEGAGKTLILDPRFPGHVVRPLHVLESSPTTTDGGSSATAWHAGSSTRSPGGRLPESSSTNLHVQYVVLTEPPSLFRPDYAVRWWRLDHRGPPPGGRQLGREPTQAAPSRATGGWEASSSSRPSRGECWE